MLPDNIWAAFFDLLNNYQLLMVIYGDIYVFTIKTICKKADKQLEIITVNQPFLYMVTFTPACFCYSNFL